MKYGYGLEDQLSEAASKEANLMCGDAISNFRTIQSFGNEEILVQSYKALLAPTFQKSKTQNFTAAMAFGFSQFSQLGGMGLMFWLGGLILDNAKVDPITQQMTPNPQDVFIALFALMFGALHAGQAGQFGPDMTKALAAATKIYKIIEVPSSINADEMERDNTKKKLDLENVKGEIEFRNVWFRYPTRKQDFVLQGLNIKINPNESVALVGESGCGKSTFVNLLMRFYDVDSGEILLDGENIKNINLHCLRKAISLVMQEPIIFNYSILENILYGKSNATNSEILANAKSANALEFIEKNDIKIEEEDMTAASLIE